MTRYDKHILLGKRLQLVAMAFFSPFLFQLEHNLVILRTE
jgi:hypothetical protein